MHPIVHDGDTCIWEPVCGEAQLDQLRVEVGDCVFCELQPINCFYAQKVLRIVPSWSIKEATQYFIGNADGGEEGWCDREHIYGRLFEALYVDKKKKSSSAASAHAGVS